MPKKRAILGLCALVVAGGMALSPGDVSADIYRSEPRKVQTAQAKDSQDDSKQKYLDDLLYHYYEAGLRLDYITPLRDEILTVGFMAKLGDLALFHDIRSGAGPTMTFRARSNGAATRSQALSKGEELLDKIETKYCLDGKRIDDIQKWIRGVTNRKNKYKLKVKSFRVDVRYTVGEPYGALFVYEYMPRSRRRLGAILVTDKEALSVLDYLDRDFFEVDRSLVERHYKRMKVNGCMNFYLRR